MPPTLDPLDESVQFELQLLIVIGDTGCSKNPPAFQFDDIFDEDVQFVKVVVL